jgi:hypothetical protein
LRPRLGYAKALVAVEHSILVAIFYMLVRDQPYHDLGPDYFIRREDPHRRARKLICQLEAIGYTVQRAATAGRSSLALSTHQREPGFAGRLRPARSPTFSLQAGRRGCTR